MRKQSKSERAKLTRTLDGLCRDIVRLKYKDICYHCDKPNLVGCDSHPCHVIPKKKGASLRRFDLFNIFLGCFHCHRWWHDNPIEAAEWFKEKDCARYGWLKFTYGGGKAVPISTIEMKELVVTLKRKISDLKGEQK